MFPVPPLCKVILVEQIPLWCLTDFGPAPWGALSPSGGLLNKLMARRAKLSSH